MARCKGLHVIYSKESQAYRQVAQQKQQTHLTQDTKLDLDSNRTIQPTFEYKYLGNMITADDSDTKAAIHRTHIGRLVNQKLAKVLKQANKKIRTKILKMVILPTVLYGVESWDLSHKKLQQVLKRFGLYIKNSYSKSQNWQIKLGRNDINFLWYAQKRQDKYQLQLNGKKKDTHRWPPLLINYWGFFQTKRDTMGNKLKDTRKPAQYQNSTGTNSDEDSYYVQARKHKEQVDQAVYERINIDPSPKMNLRPIFPSY